MKILVYDIETSGCKADVWGPGKQYVNIDQVFSDWTVIAWSAKWLDSDEVMYMDNRKRRYRNDKVLLNGLKRLINQADITVTHNGKQFDSKKLNTRYIIQNMDPPGTIRHIDTLKIAREKFNFTSNKLSYLTRILCSEYRKSEHKKFPGRELWKQCEKGNLEAWKEMEEYNKLDVLSLEELYCRFLPWHNTINFGVYLGHSRCCGKEPRKAKGRFAYTNGGKYQRYICSVCKKNYRGGANLLSKEVRRNLKK